MSARPAAWILSDGTHGMEVQARALAAALNLAITVKRYRPHPLLRAWPALGLSGWFGPHAGGDDLVPPWPAVALACGRRNAGAALWLKKRGGVPVIQIQDPKSGNRYFDLLVVPAHDRTRGANVITTTGSLNGIDDHLLTEAAAGFAGEIARLPGPRVAVAIGGSNRRYQVTENDIAGFANTLADFAATHEVSLMVTISRRSPPRAIEALRECLSDVPHTIWDGTGANPYFAYLAAATAIIVTSDSVNMVSEACATGRPVYIAALHPERGRLKHFHDQVMAAGLARPFDGTLEYWEYKPLREANRVADLIRGHLSGARSPADAG